MGSRHRLRRHRLCDRRSTVHAIPPSVQALDVNVHDAQDQVGPVVVIPPPHRVFLRALQQVDRLAQDQPQSEVPVGLLLDQLADALA